MADRYFVPIEAALKTLSACAGRLTANDAAGHVRRSIDELRLAFTTRAALEPAVHRVLRSLLMLQGAGLDGQRRDYQRDLQSVDTLVEAFETQLLPELRRVGFLV